MCVFVCVTSDNGSSVQDLMARSGVGLSPIQESKSV